MGPVPRSGGLTSAGSLRNGAVNKAYLRGYGLLAASSWLFSVQSLRSAPQLVKLLPFVLVLGLEILILALEGAISAFPSSLIVPMVHYLSLLALSLLLVIFERVLRVLRPDPVPRAHRSGRHSALTLFALRIRVLSVKGDFPWSRRPDPCRPAACIRCRRRLQRDSDYRSGGRRISSGACCGHDRGRASSFHACVLGDGTP